MQLRGSLVVALTLVASCRQLVGISDRQESPPGTALPALKYVDVACGSCADAKCATEQGACSADEACAALDTCLADVPRDDVQGRAACYDQNEAALAAAPGAKLDACRRANCLGPCLGTGGVLTTRGDDCRKCVDDSAACKAAVTACFASAACERKVDYYAYQCPDDPSCRFRALYDVYDPPTNEQIASVANLVSEVRRCLTPCDGYCGICEDFTCRGAYEWSHAPVSQASVTVTSRITYTSSSGKTPQPAAGVTVDICAPQVGEGCTAILTKQASDDGTVQLDLPLAAGRFDGHIYVHGALAYPTHFYAGRPLYRAVDDLDVSVFKAQDLSAAAKLLGTKFDDTLGHLGVASYSCWRVLAGELTLGLDVGAGTPSTAYFPIGSSNKATASGVGTWVAVNVQPGTRTVTARHGATVVVDQRPVPVAAGAITQIILFPDVATGSP